jgi:hypothetical protein
MNETTRAREAASQDASAAGAPASRTGRWQRPSFEVISLSCEISAYAPDEGDSPLF